MYRCGYTLLIMGLPVLLVLLFWPAIQFELYGTFTHPAFWIISIGYEMLFAWGAVHTLWDRPRRN